MRWWVGWFAPYVETVALVLAVLPLALLGAWLLASRRQVAGLAPGTSWRTALCEVGIVYGTVPFVVLTLQPGRGAAAAVADGSGVSLVPFRDLATMPPYQVLGNLLVFGALGLLGPVRFRALEAVSRVVLLAMAGSLAIEAAQYLWVRDRVPSVDDVILNAAGAGLAALVTRLCRKNFRPRCRRRRMPFDVGV